MTTDTTTEPTTTTAGAGVNPSSPTSTATLTRTEALAQLSMAGQSHEIVTETINGQALRVFKNAPSSLAELFADSRSDLPFLVYQQERLSFAQTHDQALRLAHALVHDYGVKKGDRVAISMRNYPEWVTSFMAVTSIGAVAVALNALWQPDELAYGLNDSGARVLIADVERLRRLESCADAVELAVIVVRTDGVPSDIDLGGNSLRDWAGVMAGGSHGDGQHAMPGSVVAPEDDATILYTSGSTGHPKGVVSTHRNILTALLSWELDGQAAALIAGITPGVPAAQPATLLAVPLFHATGSHAVFLASYRAQRKLVCMYKWDAAVAAQLIEAESITNFIAPAAMTGDLVLQARNDGVSLNSLVSVGGGGAPRAPEQVKRIEETFGNALPGTGWGMTETNAIGTTIGGQDYLDHPASSGRASAVVDLKVVDDAGHEVAAAERGELLIRGASVVSGYWQRPDANAETFIDGWMRTGDLAYLDAQGYLYIVDRIKDLVIRGGENIGCGEVEAALLEHPAVLEACVYAVPDERLGEEVGSTYYCEAEVTEPELREFLAARLAAFKIPRYLFPNSQPLPRTASGKILKRDLRAQTAARVAGSSPSSRQPI